MLFDNKLSFLYYVLKATILPNVFTKNNNILPSYSIPLQPNEIIFISHRFHICFVNIYGWMHLMVCVITNEFLNCWYKQARWACDEGVFLQQIFYLKIFPLILNIFRFAKHIQSTKLGISRVSLRCCQL